VDLRLEAGQLLAVAPRRERLLGQLVHQRGARRERAEREGAEQRGPERQLVQREEDEIEIDSCPVAVHEAPRPDEQRPEHDHHQQTTQHAHEAPRLLPAPV
jgi:hypothetical protein